jgi:hypothetical protein
VGDWLLLASIGGSKEELRPTASQPLTRPLIREIAAVRFLAMIRAFEETEPRSETLALALAKARCRGEVPAFDAFESRAALLRLFRAVYTEPDRRESDRGLRRSKG